MPTQGSPGQESEPEWGEEVPTQQSPECSQSLSGVRKAAMHGAAQTGQGELSWRKKRERRVAAWCEVSEPKDSEDVSTRGDIQAQGVRA